MSVFSSPLPVSPHRQAELAWIATCARHEQRRGDQHGRGVNRIGRLTLESADRAMDSGQLDPSSFAMLAKFGETGLPADASELEHAEWHAGIDALEFVMAKPPPKFFYGTSGTPFIDAAEAWFWALECGEASAEGAYCGSMQAGRPCDPDDVVLAMARLELPAVHARTVVAWGRKRIAPPEGSERRRLWDEAMDRLSVVLRAKGIVRQPEASVFKLLMDLPLAYLAAMSADLPASGTGDQPDVPTVASWPVAAE
jgi:hypothetical protein